MLSQRRLVGTLGISVSSLLLVFACGSDDKKTSCVTGSERCACYGNGTCDGELVCFSHLCVSSSDSGASGANSSGGSAGASTTPGDAGAGGNGQVPPGSAGSAGMEAGGSTGVPTTGGSVGNGGTVSSRGGTSSTSGGVSTTSGGTSTGMEAGQPGEGGTSEGGSPGGVPDGSLISNGDFSAGSADWNLMIQAGTAATTFTNGHACIQGDPSVSFTFGWPLDTTKAFVIEPGVPYTLSFRAVAGTPFTLVAKLGHALTPYTTVYSTAPTLTTAWATYSYQVVAASGDSGTGFVFTGSLLSSNSVCFDDVSLVKN